MNYISMARLRMVVRGRGPTRAFVGHWGKGGTGGGGVLSDLEGGGGGDDGREATEMIFFMHRACP
jgi:hypothetical protein